MEQSLPLIGGVLSLAALFGLVMLKAEGKSWLPWIAVTAGGAIACGLFDGHDAGLTSGPFGQTFLR